MKQENTLDIFHQNFLSHYLLDKNNKILFREYITPRKWNSNFSEGARLSRIKMLVDCQVVNSNIKLTLDSKDWEVLFSIYWVGDDKNTLLRNVKIMGDLDSIRNDFNLIMTDIVPSTKECHYCNEVNYEYREYCHNCNGLLGI